MATTTGGTTYVTSTDLVANYPTASLALANRVDVVASGGPNSIKTSGYTITLADILAGSKFLYNSASPGTFTLPTSGLVDGMVVQIAQIGAGAASVTGGTIVGTTSTSAQYQGLRLIYASTGATWYSVSPTAAAGLAIVTPTSIANSGGSASASGGETTFTGVNSLSLNGVFSSTYDNYMLNISFVGSTSLVLNYRMRTASDDSSANYFHQEFTSSSTTNTGTRTTSATSGRLAGLVGTDPVMVVANLNGPNLAQFTLMNVAPNDQAGFSLAILAGSARTSTQYTGISIIPSTGTITGKIRVYGLRNA